MSSVSTSTSLVDGQESGQESCIVPGPGEAAGARWLLEEQQVLLAERARPGVLRHGLPH